MEENYGGPISYYSSRRHQEHWQRHLRAARIPRPSQRCLTVQLVRLPLDAVPGLNWRLTVALVSALPGHVSESESIGGNRCECVSVHDQKTMPYSKESWGKQVVLRGKETCSKESPWFASTLLLVLVAHESASDREAAFDVKAHVIRLLSALSLPRDSVAPAAIDAGTGMRSCLLELLPKSRSTHARERTQEDFAHRVRDQLLPTTSGQQLVHLTRTASRFEAGNWRLRIQSRWTGEPPTIASSSSSSSTSTTSTTSASPRVIFFHYRYVEEEGVRQKEYQEEVEETEEEEDEEADGGDEKMDKSVEEELTKVEEEEEDDDDDDDDEEEEEASNHGSDNDIDDDALMSLSAGQAQNSKGEEDDEDEASGSFTNSDSDRDIDSEGGEGWGSQVECKVEISCPFCSFRPGAAGSHIKARDGVPFSVPSSATPSPPPPWSQQSQRLVASLLVHLDNAHLHFCFFPALDFNGHLHISVVRNRSEDLSSWKLRSLKFEPHLAQSSKHNRRSLVRLDCSHWPLIDLPDSCSSRDDSGSESGDDDDEDDDDEEEQIKDDGDYDDGDDDLMDVSAEAAGGDPEAVARLLQEAQQRGSRGYYNARVGTRVTRAEEPVPQCAYDVGNLWTRRREQGIDSFVSQDLKGEEKDFIKIWNAFMSERKVVDGSSRFSVACMQFVLARHQDIFRLNLRFNALLHFINMIYFGLIDRSELVSIMKILDSHSAAD